MKLTRSQRDALKRIYLRTDSDGRSIVNPAGDISYLAFRRTVTLWDNFGSVLLAVPYCGMVLGIESDGYTHS